jgi:hypothetical protein
LDAEIGSAGFSSKATPTRIYSFFVPAGRVERLLTRQSVKQNAVNTRSVALSKTPLPDPLERSVQVSLTPSLLRNDLINEGDIFAWAIDKCKFGVGRGEYIVNRIHGTIDDLNILHAELCL